MNKQEDKGLGCWHRVLTKQTIIYCRQKGFQPQTICKDCKDNTNRRKK